MRDNITITDENNYLVASISNSDVIIADGYKTYEDEGISDPVVDELEFLKKEGIAE